jgi:hypothetical protein
VRSNIMRIALALVLARAAGVAGPVVLNAQDSGFVKQTSNGRVTLQLWPQWRDTVLVVQVRANTHAVDLSTVNLSEQARLVVAGTEIAPLSAGQLNRHHAQTEVIFRLGGRPTSFAITIRDVPDIPLRTLTWPPAAADHRP